MHGSSFGYLLKEGARNIYANRLMSLASIGVLIACLLLIGTSVLFTLNVNSLVGYVESQNEVVIFLADGAESDLIDEIDLQLQAIDNIEDVVFISKEQGLEEWIDSMDNSTGLFDGLYSDNILPNSFRIKIKDLSIIDQTIDEINLINGVDSVSAPIEVAQTVTSLKRAVNTAGSGMVILLVIVASVIIANTIKITVFNRRKEISIMKFVGATDTFIRLPFVVEGFLLGLISAILSFGLLWGAYELLINWLSQNTAGWFTAAIGHMIVFGEIALPLFGAFAAAGIGIGTLGSMLFVRRYLKV